MGKASRRKDIVDVIKEQTRKEKRDAGMRRSNATGISAAALSVIGPQHTMGEGAGIRHVGGSCLQMHSFDIKDVDRLLFSTTTQTEERLDVAEHGIEANTFYDSVNNETVSVGMTFQIPSVDEVGYTGMMYKFKIGDTSQVRIRQNTYNGTDIDLTTTNADEPASVHFIAASGVTEGHVNSLSIFSDGTDIKAKNSSGTVFTLTSGGANYISNDVNSPNGTQLDSYFGSANGTIGVQSYAGASAPSPQQRVWVKSSGSWNKMHYW